MVKWGSSFGRRLLGRGGRVHHCMTEAETGGPVNYLVVGEREDPRGREQAQRARERWLARRNFLLDRFGISSIVWDCTPDQVQGVYNRFKAQEIPQNLSDLAQTHHIILHVGESQFMVIGRRKRAREIIVDGILFDTHQNPQNAAQYYTKLEFSDGAVQVWEQAPGQQTYQEKTLPITGVALQLRGLRGIILRK